MHPDTLLGQGTEGGVKGEGVGVGWGDGNWAVCGAGGSSEKSVDRVDEGFLDTSALD